jgi:hypothetical protein
VNDDNEPEFISMALDKWGRASRRSAALHNARSKFDVRSTPGAAQRVMRVIRDSIC